MTVGEKIKSLRIKRGFSQETLAEKVHTSRQTIYHWENDITIPNINDIKNLSDAFNCDHDYFFNESSQYDDIHTTDEVVSDLYKGVKKHWRKIYIYFFISGSMFIGMGLLIRFISNQIISNPSGFPSAGPTPGSIFNGFSNFALIIGIILFLSGIIFFIKDYQKQKEYQ